MTERGYGKGCIRDAEHIAQSTVDRSKKKHDETGSVVARERSGGHVSVVTRKLKKCP